MAIGDKKPVVMQSDRAVNGGIATLDSKGNVPFEQMGNAVRPNLLRNWYFANPVNQREFTERSASGYTVDGWRALNQQYVKVIDGVGLQLSPDGTNNRHFLQYIEHPERVAGKKVTFSVLIAENTYSSMSYISLYVNGSAMTGGNITAGRTGLCSVTLTVPENVTSLAVLIRSNATLTETGAITILAAKLELGNTQTLAHQDASGNWVLNEIPDYGEELAKCQRYFVRYGSDEHLCNVPAIVTAATGNNMPNFLIVTPVPMRANPSLKMSGVIVRTLVDVTDYAVTNGNTVQKNADGVVVALTTDGNVSVSGVPLLRTGQSGYLELSAELS